LILGGGNESETGSVGLFATGDSKPNPCKKDGVEPEPADVNGALPGPDAGYVVWEAVFGGVMNMGDPFGFVRNRSLSALPFVGSVLPRPEKSHA